MSSQLKFTVEKDLGPGVISYKVSIPIRTLIELDFSTEEQYKLDKATQGPTSVLEMLDCLKMIVSKIVEEKEPQGG